jgi:hypothetical protein
MLAIMERDHDCQEATKKVVLMVDGSLYLDLVVVVSSWGWATWHLVEVMQF